MDRRDWQNLHVTETLRSAVTRYMKIKNVFRSGRTVARYADEPSLTYQLGQIENALKSLRTALAAYRKREKL